MRAILALLILVLTAACSAVGTPINLSSGLLPSYECKGKSTFVVTGSALGAAAVTVSADCGEGFMLKQTQPDAPKPQ